MRVGLIGAGRMGALHARVIAGSTRGKLDTIVDSHLDRARALADEHGGDASADVSDTFDLDAIVLATPTAHHYECAMTLIEQGVPLLIEKPLAPDLELVKNLVDTAERRSVPLTCGFVERFNPAIVTAKTMIDGPVLHFVSLRHSPPQPRIASDVIDDLLIHDIDLVSGLMDQDPETIAASGWKGRDSGMLEIVDAVLSWRDRSVATLSVDRRSQRKVRAVSLTTSELLIELDLVRQDVTVFRHVSHEVVPGSADYRAETVVDIPFVRNAGEPLALQFEHFLDIVEGRKESDEEMGSLLGPHRIAAQVKAAVTTA